MSLHQKDARRTWHGDSRFVAPTSHSRAYSTAHETDEHPFAQLTDDGSEHSVPVKERLNDFQIELESVSVGRDPVQLDGIVITREIHLTHHDD